MIVTRSALGRLLAASLLPAALVAQKPELPLKHVPEPTRAAISAADLMSRLYIFADDSMMGREVGTIYHLKATDYIEREVRRLGLVPAGDNDTYFQNLPVFGKTPSTSRGISIDGKTFIAPGDFIPRDAGVFGGVDRSIDGAPIIYGGTFAPGDTSQLISPAEAAGKVVVISVPNGPDGKPITVGYRQPLTVRYLRAAAIAVASLDGFSDEQKREMLQPTVSTAQDVRLALPRFLYVGPAMADAMFGAPLSTLKRGALGKTIKGDIASDSARAPARNVVAILRGSDPVLRNQYVAIGAHNDHIGFNHSPVDHDSIRAFDTVVRPRGEDDPNRPARPEEAAAIRQILDSLRRIHTPRLDSIYNGADDDGSGSVAVLEIAEAFARSETKPKRSILFVWHAGEEKGLWGSEYFTDHPTVPRDSIVAQLNMDMVGRGGPQDEKGGGPGYLQLIGSRRLSTELGDLVEAVAKTEPTPFHFDYSYDANGHPEQYYCRSDHYEYARYGIPITFFTTGGHRDYHQVTDEPQYIDYDQLARVATLVHDVAIRVANLDHRVVVDKPKPNPKGRCVQ
jgi:Peptidase family M28